MPSGIPNRKLTLLEAAHSEAKRFGHVAAGALHLALTLGRDPETTRALESTFGPNARTRIIERLRRPEIAGSPTAEELLAQAADDTNAAILAVIAPHVQLDDASPPREAAGQTQPAPEDPLYAPGALLRAVRPDPEVIGREAVVTEILQLIGRRDPAVPLLVAPAGAGRTAIGGALAARVAAPGYAGPLAGCRVVRPDPASVLSGATIDSFDNALDMVPDGAVVFLDDFERFAAIGTGGDGALTWILVRLRGAIEDPRFRLVLTVEEGFAGRLKKADESLAADVHTIRLDPLPAEDLRTIALRHGADLARHHQVSLSPELCELAAARPPAGRAHPALAVELLDGACARAALRADRTVREQDLGGSAAVAKATVAPADLAAALRERIRGQDHVIDAVVSRLTITRAQLDLRPERPDGVFLFVGPTGVGKTELARALCSALHGAEDAAHLIRLDMSEFSDEYTISRLIGPAPGYVGFTEPESWLTTRVHANPDCVVLLDEIEKAHPKIWNAFLQVFDAGRLADGRGTVADFSRTIVIMTSNLGAHDPDAGRAPVGFAATQEPLPERDRAAARIMAAVRAAMLPEFINRIDDVIAFAPLDEAVIAEIARHEVARALARLQARGYRVQLDDAVVELIGRIGYDPAYGARHLQRNLEALLLVPIARAGHRTLRAFVLDGQIVVAAAEASPA